MLSMFSKNGKSRIGKCFQFSWKLKFQELTKLFFQFSRKWKIHVMSNLLPQFSRKWTFLELTKWFFSMFQKMENPWNVPILQKWNFYELSRRFFFKLNKKENPWIDNVALSKMEMPWFDKVPFSMWQKMENPCIRKP